MKNQEVYFYTKLNESSLAILTLILSDAMDTVLMP